MLQLLVLFTCLLCLLIPVIANDYFGNFFSQRGTGSTELYDRLGVSPSSSQEEIKQAFRRRAMVVHPDKGGDAEEFKRLNEAYETLSDAGKRAQYDRFGSVGAQPASFEGMGSFADVFRSFENSFGNRFFTRPLVAQVEVSLEDLFKGKKVSIVISRQKSISVVIPPGARHGQQIILKGEVTDVRGVPRDLIVQVLEIKHPLFIRRGDDLVTSLEISLREALLGFEKPIRHLDGNIVWIRSLANRVTRNDEALVLDGLGMPVLYDDKRRGRLLVRVKVLLPQRLMLSEGEKELLDSLLPREETDEKKPEKGERVVTPSSYTEAAYLDEEEETSENPFSGLFFR